MSAGKLTRRSLLVAGAGTGIGLALGASPAHAASLTYRYQKQETLSWCSAASTRIALTARNRTPSQASLADSLGLRNGAGLQSPELIAKVLNERLGLSGAGSYVLRIAPTGTLYERLQMRVKASIDAGFPVVINMNSVDGDTFSAGHYIAIVGYDANRYQIADPYDPNRNGVWRSKQNIVDWNKLNRFTAYTP